MVNSPFCASQGRAGRGQTLLFALSLRGQQAVIPAGTADPTYVQARSTRPNPIFFPDQLEPTIPFSCACSGAAQTPILSIGLIAERDKLGVQNQ